MKRSKENGFVAQPRLQSDSETKPWSKEELIRRGKAIDKWTRAWVNEFIDTITRRKPVSTHYQFLAHQIEAKFEGAEGTRTIVFSSGDPEDISTEVLLTTAYFLQNELGKKVLLIDGAFDYSDLTDRLDMDEEPGLAEVLYQSAQPSDVIREVVDDGVYILPAGTAKPSGGRNIGRETARNVLEALDYFDYILIQQSAITMDTRYLAFAQEADLVLLYIEERQTLVTEFEANQKTLREYEIENVGFIMTSAD